MKSPPKPKRKTGRPPIPWDIDMMLSICEEFSKHGRFGDACRSIGVTKQAGQKKREADSVFDAMIRGAWEDFRERTIANVQEFAWQGKTEPIMHQGSIVGARKVWFPRMMELEARRVVPEYREKTSVELSGDPERPVRVDLSKLSTAELRQLKLLTAKAKADGR